MVMSKPQIAYLGPEGTFSHILTRRRYGDSLQLIPSPTIDDVFDFVEEDTSRLGIVPIENSSGGNIYDTVDRLVDEKNILTIHEELSMHVNLALLGHEGEEVRVLYSHFAPLHHCEPWIKEHLPKVERHAVSSTGEAAKLAAADKHSAALGPKESAKIYDLDILVYPVEQHLPNVTQFYCIGHPKKEGPDDSKSSLVVVLPNTPGSLCNFLEPFKDSEVNLTRILSRPLVGRPNQYVFFIDIKGIPKGEPVKRTLELAKENSLYTHLRILGSYPVLPPFTS